MFCLVLFVDIGVPNRKYLLTCINTSTPVLPRKTEFANPRDGVGRSRRVARKVMRNKLHGITLRLHHRYPQTEMIRECLSLKVLTPRKKENAQNTTKTTPKSCGRNLGKQQHKSQTMGGGGPGTRFADEHEKGTNFTRRPQRTCNRAETQLWHLTSHNMPFAVATSAAARASTTVEPFQQQGGTSTPTPAPRTPRAPQLPLPRLRSPNQGPQRARSRYTDNNQESTSTCLCNCTKGPRTPNRSSSQVIDAGNSLPSSSRRLTQASVRIRRTE